MTRHRLATVAAAAALVGVQLGVLVALDRLVGRLADPRFVALAGAPATRTTLVRSEFRVPVRTNAAGFRGAALPAPGRRAPGTVRIVVLGDSFTWGYGVRERQAYPARLARLLRARTGRPVEVVNLGLPGAGPLDYRWHLTHTALALDPDLVVVGLFANDVNDLYQIRRWGLRGPLYALADVRAGAGQAWWKAAASTAVPNLWVLTARAASRLHPGPAHAEAAPAAPGAGVRPAPARDPVQAIAALGARYGRRDAVLARYAALPSPDRSALDALVRGETPTDDMRPLLLLGALVDPDAEADAVLLRSPARRAAADETAGVLEDVADRVRAHGGRAVFALFPASEQVNAARWPVLEDAGYRLDPAMLTDTTLEDAIRDVAARSGTPYVDLVAAFRRHRGADLYYRVDEHWNARGQAFAASRLAAALAPLVREVPER